MFVVTRAPASRQTCAAAHSRGNPRLPKTPATWHAARWWPKESSWRPHRQVRTVGGRGICRRRRRTTRNKCVSSLGRGKRRRRQSKRRNDCASILITLDVGSTVKGADARGPCWDLIRARAESSNVGHTSFWMNACSTCFTACRCQPTLGWLGSGSTSMTGGDSDSSNHGGICKPASASDLPHSWTDLKHGAVPCWRWVIINSCDVRVSLPHHPQTVGPACPMCGCAGYRLALVRPNPPADNAKLATTLSFSGPRRNSQDLAQASPHPGIVMARKLCSELGSDCPQPEISTCGGGPHITRMGHAA